MRRRAARIVGKVGVRRWVLVMMMRGGEVKRDEVDAVPYALYARAAVHRCRLARADWWSHVSHWRRARCMGVLVKGTHHYSRSKKKSVAWLARPAPHSVSSASQAQMPYLCLPMARSEWHAVEPVEQRGPQRQQPRVRCSPAPFCCCTEQCGCLSSTRSHPSRHVGSFI